jgi:hypothetical protein
VGFERERERRRQESKVVGFEREDGEDETGEKYG